MNCFIYLLQKQMTNEEISPSPISRLTAREHDELEQYNEKIEKISLELEQEGKFKERTGAVSLPAENILDVVKHKNLRISEEKVGYMLHHVNEMTLKNLIEELQNVGLSHRGIKSDLRDRLRKFYREQYFDFQNYHSAAANAYRSRHKTREMVSMDMEQKENDCKNAQKATEQPKQRHDASRNSAQPKFRYLVAIDIEATCYQKDNDINYEHETIELPAILVEWETWRIVDKFRTFVKPEINTEITEFCAKFTGITQEDVDNAPIFPEAWSLLMQWMEKHGLMGGDENASFVVVTDGPNDIQHFLQRSFLQYNMKIPHEFRHFINIKLIFERHVETLIKGDGTPSLVKMCDRLNVPKETCHTGIGDAIMVAKIAIRLARELKLNLYITNRVKLGKGRKRELPPPISPEDYAKEQKKMRKLGQSDSSTNIAPRRLPYELFYCSEQEYKTGAYWDCESCGE